MKSALIVMLLASTGLNAQTGSYISVDEHGNPIVYSAEDLNTLYGGSFDSSALDEYTEYADRTSGVMGFCPKFSDLPAVMDQILEKITKTSNEKIDIALLLDTTGSMTDEINAVKKNLQLLLDKISSTTQQQSIRVALVEYKDGPDQGDDFRNRIISDFTADFPGLQQTIQSVLVTGGGDHREAILDGFEVSDEQLGWRASAAKNLILIGDAPGHTVSKTSQKSVDEILTQLDTYLAIHPILVTAR